MEESKGDKKAYATLECRSFDSPPKTPLWLHHSSSSFFFLLLLQWSFWEWKRVLLWILALNKARYTPLLKAKHQQKSKSCAGSRKVVKKNWKLGAGGTHGLASQAAQPCVHQHGPPVVAPAWSVPDTSRTLCFELLLDLGICLWSSCFGPLGLVLLLSWPSLA